MSGGVAAALDEALKAEGDMNAVVQSGLFDDLSDAETGAVDVPTPFSRSLGGKKATRGRPKGAKGRRTEEVTAWLLQQHRHPLSVMMEAYPNIMYIECGNPFTTDAQASSFRLIVTHKVGGPYWGGQAVSYFPISLDSSNGDLRFSSNGGIGGGAITFDDATFFGSKGAPEIVGFGMTNTLFRIRERGAANQVTLTTNISDPQNGTPPSPDDATKSMWQVEFGAGRDIFAVGRYAPGVGQAIVELFRVDSAGRFMIGQTATAAGADGQLAVTGGAGRSALTVKNTAGAAFPVGILWNNAVAGDNVLAQFGTEVAYTARGSIDYNRAGGQVRYNVTSDYRSKIDKGAVEDATDRLLAIDVRRVRMLGGATEDIDAFIAHQLQASVPAAVSGVHDQVDGEGRPIFQQVDPSKVVPLVVASLQDTIRRVDRIETELGLERLAA